MRLKERGLGWYTDEVSFDVLLKQEKHPMKAVETHFVASASESPSEKSPQLLLANVLGLGRISKHRPS